MSGERTAYERVIRLWPTGQSAEAEPASRNGVSSGIRGFPDHPFFLSTALLLRLRLEGRSAYRVMGLPTSSCLKGPLGNGASRSAPDAVRSLAEGARCVNHCGNRLQTT